MIGLSRARFDRRGRCLWGVVAAIPTLETMSTQESDPASSSTPWGRSAARRYMVLRLVRLILIETVVFEGREREQDMQRVSHVDILCGVFCQ